MCFCPTPDSEPDPDPNPDPDSDPDSDPDPDPDLDLSISRRPTRSLGCPHTPLTTRKGTASRTPTAPGVRCQDYKFTKSVFETYCENDSLVWTKCDLYDNMPSDVMTASSKTTPVKKRSRSSFEVDTPEAPRVVKTICLLTDSSEESSEEGGD